MNNAITTTLIGVGMFLLGWFTHTWVEARRLADAEEAGPATTRWTCNGCGRVKHLPTELDARVLVCNNCNVRLVRSEAA